MIGLPEPKDLNIVAKRIQWEEGSDDYSISVICVCEKANRESRTSHQVTHEQLAADKNP